METKLVGPRGSEATSSDPGELTLERRTDGRVWAVRDGTERAVWVRRCFPWSEPGRFLSVAELAPVSRRVLEEALVAAGFVFEVTRVLAIEEEVEIRHWRVETRQGPRAFQTRLDDWPRLLPHGGLLVRDVAGDLYHLADPNALDRKSRALLWAFVD